MSLLRSKSPTRAEAIAIALRPAPVFSYGVLLGIKNNISIPIYTKQYNIQFWLLAVCQHSFQT